MSSSPATAFKTLQDLEQIRREYDALCAELKMNENDAVRVLQTRIKLLHDYNDVKDAATLLMGHYAHRNSKTLGQVYQQFGADTDD